MYCLFHEIEEKFRLFSTKTFLYTTTYLQGHNYPLALVQSVELQCFQLCCNFVHLVRKFLATPHISLPVITSLLCILNPSLNVEPAYCSLHGTADDQVNHIRTRYKQSKIQRFTSYVP